MAEHQEMRATSRILIDSIHKGLTTMIFGMVVWAATTLNDTSGKLIQLTEQLKFVSQTVAEIKNNGVGDADLKVVEQRIDVLEKRITRLEK